MVWDLFQKGKHTRENTPVYQRFGKVLKLANNKTELFKVIADTMSGLFRNQQKVLLITRQQTVLSNRAVDLQRLKKDYRIFLHAMEQSQLEFKRLMVITVDTDVMVIDLHAHWNLNVTELWIKFGTGKDRRWLPVHSYAELLGERHVRTCLQKTFEICFNYLITQMNRTMGNGPSTRDALLQHVRRCHSQTYGCVALHWTKLIKTLQIWVGLLLTKAGSS